MSTGKVKVYSNVNWIDNLLSKPTPMALDPEGINRVNKELPPQHVNKRRLDALDKELPNYADYSNDETPATSFSGERSAKRRRETSVKAVTDFVLKPKPTI